MTCPPCFLPLCVILWFHCTYEDHILVTIIKISKKNSMKKHTGDPIPSHNELDNKSSFLRMSRRQSRRVWGTLVLILFYK